MTLGIGIVIGLVMGIIICFLLMGKFLELENGRDIVGINTEKRAR